MIVHLSRDEKCNIPRCSIELNQTLDFGDLFRVLFLIQVRTQETAKLKQGIVTLIGQFADQL